MQEEQALLQQMPSGSEALYRKLHGMNDDLASLREQMAALDARAAARCKDANGDQENAAPQEDPAAPAAQLFGAGVMQLTCRILLHQTHGQACIQACPRTS